MKKLLKIFLGLVAGLLVLLVVGVAVAVGALYRTIAPVAGTFTVEGLSADVEIRYDNYERPYVTADTLADALYAQGWLHAQHRFWQMDMFRRAGSGRLSALLSASMLESDQELWRYGVPKMAQQIEANASEEMREYVAAYVAGVNAALESDTFSALEYMLIQQEPEPWTVSDVYALGAVMAFQSANNASKELVRLALFTELGPERAAIFLSHDANLEDFPYVLSDSSGVIEAIDRMHATDSFEQPMMPSFAFGSNGWVVAPERSKTGNALFAFDSHDDLGLPNLFYEVNLFFGEGRQIRGWSVAGLPGVINGYNERIAWGFTNIGDTQDLYLETRDESEPTRFKDGDSWYEARTETIAIPVSGRATPESFTITYTRNGPLISEDPPISLRWTVQDIGDMGIDSILQYNLAQNWDEYTAALDGLAAPSLNATYADIDGNIGFRTAGLLPIRGVGDGLIPLSGDDPENRWQGYVANEDMPSQLNPAEGFLAAANARVNAEGDGVLVSADNAPGYRIRRIKEVLSGNSELTLNDMRTLQTDWYDQQAALLWPALEASLESGSWSGVVADARDALVEWMENPIAEKDSGAALLFQAWYRALAIEVFAPAMSEDLFTQLYKNNYPLNAALDELILRDIESDWWRDNRDGIICAGFESAVQEIQSVQGGDVSTWRLDVMHAVKLEHELGKAVPQLGWLFNADPAPWGGGATTVGRARYRYDRAYDATAGATVRVIGEMTQPAPMMEAIIPGGQSGHPLSQHYADQFRHWLNGETHPIARSAEEIQGTVVTLRAAN